MRQHGLVGLFFALIMSAPADAAGLKLLTVPADASGPEIIVLIWYPSKDKPAPVSFGDIPMMAARDGTFDGPGDGKGLPLVVLSHGAGGSSVVFHHTAERLADAGFVVASPNHPGDWARDRSQYYDLSVYVQRPLHIKRAIDHLTGAASVATMIDAGRIGMYGFSRGGYTTLVVIGADPDFGLRLPMCEGRTDKICDQIRAHDYPTGPLTHDRRIKAAVVADPLAIFFTAEGLAGITIPVQLWASEKGGDGIDPKAVDALNTQLKAPHTFIKVENSQHFSFLTVCPPAFAERNPDGCKDAPGFDRAQFHDRFNEELIKFFRANL
jgi:predicted dienelactone hydrolase